jgi:hypothetical protein
MELTPETLEGLVELTGWTPEQIVAVNKRVEEKQLTLTAEEHEAIERQVDEAFLKCTGRTYREAESPPVPEYAQTEDDWLGKLTRDFPELFGQ